MNSTAAVAALWTLVVAVIGGMTAILPGLFSLIKERIESERKKLTREASFDAASTIEERERKKPTMTSAEKLAAAVTLANENTPSSVVVKPVDVEAALPRVRASLPSTSIAPLPIPVTVVSSEPPAGASDERVTNPLPPAARVPKEWSVGTTQAAGLQQQPRKP